MNLDAVEAGKFCHMRGMDEFADDTFNFVSTQFVRSFTVDLLWYAVGTDDEGLDVCRFAGDADGEAAVGMQRRMGNSADMQELRKNFSAGGMYGIIDLLPAGRLSFIP